MRYSAESLRKKHQAICLCFTRTCKSIKGAALPTSRQVSNTWHDSLPLVHWCL